MVKATGLYTITEVYDGTNGFDIKSGRVATLTKNRFVLPKNKLGEIPSYSDAKTTMKIYDGISEVTDNYTITVVTDGLTGTLTGNTFQVSSISGTSGTATLTATDGTETFEKVFSVFVSTTTTDELVTCEIIPSSLSFLSKRGKEGKYKPSYITLTPKITGVTAEIEGETKQVTTTGKNMYRNSDTFSGNNGAGWIIGGTVDTDVTLNKSYSVRTINAWAGPGVNVKKLYEDELVSVGDNLSYSVFFRTNFVPKGNFSFTLYRGSSSTGVAVKTFDASEIVPGRWYRVAKTFEVTDYSITQTNTRIELNYYDRDDQYYFGNNRTNYVWFSQPQIELGNSVTKYEPSTGGKETPLPDYPQSINSKTGIQNIPINGKNLLKITREPGPYNELTLEDKGNGYYRIYGTTGNNARSIPLTNIFPDIIEGQDYTYSVCDVTGNFVGSFPISIYNTDTTIRYNFFAVSNTTRSHTKNIIANNGIAGVTFYIAANSTTDFTFRLQFEKGSTATPYQKYIEPTTVQVDLGDIELCRIWNYKDKIYKSGDTWYLHKEIGKTTITGNSSITIYNGRYWIGFNKPPDSIMYGEGNFNRYKLWLERAYYSDSLDDVYSYQTSLSGYAMGIMCKSTDTAADLKEKIDGSLMYYPLATAIDTEITDANLISQLNKLWYFTNLYNYGFNWEYSVDGITYIDVPSTYINEDKEVVIPYDSDLANITSTNFKLSTNIENVYDDVSILKLYNSDDYFIIRSNTEPEDPDLGDMWLNTDTGDLYVYDYIIYKDGLRIDENNHLINSDGYLVNSYGHLLDEDGNQITQYSNDELIVYYIINYDGYYIDANDNLLNEDFAIMDDDGHFRDSSDHVLVSVFDETTEELKYYIMRPDGTPDLTQPATPVLGTPVTSTGPVMGGEPRMDWVSSSNSDIRKVDYSKIKTFTIPPAPPYNAGDVWFVQNVPTSEMPEGHVPFDANEVGLVKVCVVTKLEGETASADDWFTPESAYTPLTSIETITGKTADEWYASSKNITSLINDVSNDVVSVETQVSNLAVRSSDIEMSFSHSGTANYLYNSSGQYGLNKWRNRLHLNEDPDNGVSIGTITQYKDTRTQIKSGYMFRLGFKHSISGDPPVENYSLTDGIISDPIQFPTGDIYSLSFKYKNVVKNTALRVKLIPYSDVDGTNEIQVAGYDSSLLIPYSEDYDFHKSHLYFYKSMFQNLNLECFRVSLSIEDLLQNPVINLDYSSLDDIPNPQMFLGRRIKLTNDHTYLAKSKYELIEPYESDEIPGYTKNDIYNAIWLCSRDIITEENLKYVKGIYYLFTGFHSYILDGETKQAPTFIPFSDSYDVTLLNQNQYYIQRVYDFEDITSQNLVVTNETPDDCISVADIMLNGGSTVMAWTPSRYESIYSETIRFSKYGIEISGEYVSESTKRKAKRIINETQDVAYIIDDLTGNIVKLIWNINPDGVMTNDLRSYGSLSLGYARNPDGSKDDSNQGKWTQVYKMERNSSNEGIDEYIYIN